MSQARRDKTQEWNFYRIADGDSRDIGFSLKGYEFRWLNPRKQERSMDRPWKPLNTTDLPKAFLEVLQKERPGFFGVDGQVRRDEMILGWCRTDDYNVVRKHLQERNEEELRKLQQTSQDGALKTKSEFETFEGFENFKK